MKAKTDRMSLKLKIANRLANMIRCNESKNMYCQIVVIILAFMFLGAAFVLSLGKFTVNVDCHFKVTSVCAAVEEQPY